MNRTVATLLLASLSFQAQAGDSVGVGELLEKKGGAEAGAAAALLPENLSSTVSSAMGLLPMLTKSLGVDATQASGGVGALLAAVKSVLGGDFSTIAKAIPNIEGLLAAVPKVAAAEGGKSEGLLGSALKMAGEMSPEVKAGTQLLSQFKSLGLGAEMVPKFGDVTSKFLQQGGNAEASNLLSDTLGKLL